MSTEPTSVHVEAAVAEHWRRIMETLGPPADVASGHAVIAAYELPSSPRPAPEAKERIVLRASLDGTLTGEQQTLNSEAAFRSIGLVAALVGKIYQKDLAGSLTAAIPVFRELFKVVSTKPLTDVQVAVVLALVATDRATPVALTSKEIVIWSGYNDPEVLGALTHLQSIGTVRTDSGSWRLCESVRFIP